MLGTGLGSVLQLWRECSSGFSHQWREGPKAACPFGFMELHPGADPAPHGWDGLAWGLWESRWEARSRVSWTTCSTLSQSTVSAGTLRARMYC